MTGNGSDPAGLASVLKFEDLPPLAGVRRISDRGVVVTWQLTLEDGGELWLRREVLPTGRQPLQNELAALSFLEHAEVPGLTAYRILPCRGLPASLSEVPRGMAGHHWLRAHPRRLPEVLRILGRLLARLQEHPLPGFGFRGDLGVFVADRASWPDAVAHQAESAWIRLRTAGYGDLDVVNRLWTTLQRGLRDLRTPEAFALVHRGLKPSAVQLLDEPGSELSAIHVVHWETAALADPLLEWASLLWLPASMFRGIVEGFGVEAARETLVDHADRLQLYGALEAMCALADSVARLVHRHSEDAARELGECFERCEDVVQPDAAQAQLDIVFGRGPPRSPVRGRADPHVHVLRRTSHVLGSLPVATFDRIPFLVAALSAIDLARSAEGETARQLAETARSLLESGDFSSHSAPVPPAADRSAWRATLIQEAIARTHGGRALSLCCLVWGLEVLDALGDRAPASSLAGLRSLVHGARSRESADWRGTGKLRAIHGILGEDAAIRLGAGDLAEVFAEQTADALDVLSIGKPPEDRAPESVASLLPFFASARVVPGDGLLFLPFAAAMNRLSLAGRLRHRPSVLAATCFPRGSTG